MRRVDHLYRALRQHLMYLKAFTVLTCDIDQCRNDGWRIGTVVYQSRRRRCAYEYDKLECRIPAVRIEDH